MMKTSWCAAYLAIVIASMATGDVLACGDKFLVPSRGLRFELTASAREQARVLVYLNPASSLPGLATKLSLDAALRKAGYRAAVAANAVEIGEMLRQGPWDVVLLDVADGPIAGQTTGAPALIAVAVNQKDSDLGRAKKQFAAILKSPSRSQSFVAALDIAVATRRTVQAKAADRRQ
jgi:hypothetical protein